MISTSIEYFIFLVVVLFLYYLTPLRYRNHFLALASMLFYMNLKLSYGLIILAIILSNYFIGPEIWKAQNKKLKTRYLYLSLLVNIGILVYFKYWNFLVDNISLFPTFLEFKSNYFLTEIILPLGLSYYIFQTIGYILDIYRGSIKPEKDFIKFSLFTLFFPKLLVGPIERAKNILPQLSEDHLFNNVNIVEGSKIILWGLYKKIVVADRISLYVDAVYSNLPQHNSSSFLFATFLYPIQVYADFSGYTDIAIGTARLFGINLMDNFKQPLFARNVSDFWRRWHISLSSWVNDYIYYPILFKRREWGNIGVFYAVFVSFIIIGIWHGASWNYIVFGVIQAIAIIFEFITRKTRKKISGTIHAYVYNSFSIFFTFLFFAFSLIIFRTTTLSGMLDVVNAIKAGPGKLFIDQPSTILFIFIGSSIMLISDFRKEYGFLPKTSIDRRQKIAQPISYALLIIFILIAGVFDGGQFIYFAF